MSQVQNKSLTSLGASVAQAGSLIALYCTGVQDEQLHDDPTDVLWKGPRQRYTHYARSVSHITAGGAVSWANEAHWTAPRFADLVDGMHVSTIYDVLSAEHGADHWVEGLGIASILTSTIEIGNVQFDRQTTQTLDIFDELLTEEGKGAFDAVGKYGGDVAMLRAVSADKVITHTALPWWFTLKRTQVLPLLSMTFTHVEVRVQFATKQSCIKLADGHCWADAPLQSGESEVIRVQPQTVGGDILDCRLTIAYIYLTDAERDMFHQNQHYYTISTWQRNTDPFQIDVTEDDGHFQHQYMLHHPVSFMVMIMQWTGWSSPRSLCQDPLNYSHPTLPHEDPLVEMSVMLNGHPLHSSMTGPWMRNIETNGFPKKPKKRMYVIRACADAENLVDCTGSINMSKIENMQISGTARAIDREVAVQMCGAAVPRPMSYIMTMHARCFNGVRLQKHMCMLIFAS